MKHITIFSLIVGAPKAASRDGRDIFPGLIFNCQLQNLDIRNSTCRPIGLSSGGEYSKVISLIQSSKNMFLLLSINTKGKGRQCIHIGASIVETHKKKSKISLTSNVFRRSSLQKLFKPSK